MEINIKGEPKEIADLVTQLQSQPFSNDCGYSLYLSIMKAEKERARKHNGFIG